MTWTDSFRSISWRKGISWSLNVFAATLILIFIVPDWRLRFQGWYQSFLMPQVEFVSNENKDLGPLAEKWAFFNLNNHLVTLSDFGTKPKVIAFWATWCPPCRAELPELKELTEKFATRIAVLAVTEESTDVIKESGLSEEYDFLYYTQQIPVEFGVQSFPSLFILDGDHMMVYRQTGAGELNTPENVKFLESLIN